MFTKSGSIQRESVQLNTVSADHFFQCVKEEKEDDLRNYKVWLLKEELMYRIKIKTIIYIYSP